MDERFIREAYIIGDGNVERIKKSAVLIFGVGGVGSYCAEALARLGVGRFMLVDGDDVSKSNINRQLVALSSTIGRSKVDVMRERILDINPECTVETAKMFYLPECADAINFSGYSCVIDAVDTVTAKIEICVRATAAGVPIVSAMGAGNKLCPEMLEATDIYKTSVCPLARVMRRELRVRKIKSLRVVYSKEEPRARHADHVFDGAPEGKIPPGSVSFVPSAAGLILAKEAMKFILGGNI